MALVDFNQSGKRILKSEFGKPANFRRNDSNLFTAFITKYPNGITNFRKKWNVADCAGMLLIKVLVLYNEKK